MRSTLESAPKTEGGTGSAPANVVRASVAGLDESGHMFRDTVSIIALDGRDCIFQAKSKPELNSWVLVEILPSKSGDKPASVQGQVVTLEPDSQSAGQFRIRVELETKQTLKIGDYSQEMKSATPEASRVPAPAPKLAATLPGPALPAAPAPAPASPAASGSGLTSAPVPAQTPARPAAAAPVAPAPVKAALVAPEKETPVKESAPKMAPLPPLSKARTEPGAEWPAPLLNTQAKKIAVLSVPEIATAKAPPVPAAPIPAIVDKEIISAAVAHEVKQQLAATKASLDEDLEKMVQGSIAREMKQQVAATKTSLDEDLEKMVQRAVASGLDSLIQQTIDKKFSANFQSAIQTINDDLTFQLAGHVAKNEELRGNMEALAKRAAADQIAQWQKTAGGNVASSEILQSLEKSVAEMQSRQKAAQENAASTIERLEAMDRQILDSAARLQKVVDQMNVGARATIDKFDSHIASQLTSWSEHIQNYADGVAQEKVAIFTSGLEHQVSTHMTEAQQLLEKLSEGVRQSREALQAQEAQIKERYQSIIADLDKEIRSTLLKIAGVA